MRNLKWIVLVIALLFVSGTLAQTTGPTYFYVATAVDAGGFESAFSNQASCTFLQGQKTCVLTWTAAVSTGTAIAGYNMYRGTVSGGPYTKINTALITTGVTYTDSFTLPNAPSGLTGKSN